MWSPIWMRFHKMCFDSYNQLLVWRWKKSREVAGFLEIQQKRLHTEFGHIVNL